MTDLTTGLRPANAHFRAGAGAILTLVLTCVHHAYGAATYGTPWRLHILHLAIPAAIAVVVLLLVGSARRDKPGGRLSTWVAVAIILAFPVAMIGLYEGGYNHAVKNIVYFGFGEDLARAVFPPPTYEMPNDLVFEITGIAQFPLSIVSAVLAVALLRGSRR